MQFWEHPDICDGITQMQMYIYEQKLESQVNLLVNNAGLIANWQKSLDIMLYGVCHGTWLAIDKMSVTKGGSGGRIVNIASMAGFLEGTLKLLLSLL